MLDTFSLYLVTDSLLIGEKDLVDVVLSAVRGGVTAVQLREKELSTREFVKIARKLKDKLSALSIPLIINDRVDIALAVGADGVHLGQTDLDYLDAKKILGKDLIIGLTVENMEQAKEAMKLDVSYLGLSSIFKTNTKNEAKDYWDKRRISELKMFSKHPLIGIGGINKENVKDVMSWGLDGVAVVSAICSAKNLDAVESEAKRIKLEIENYYENK